MNWKDWSAVVLFFVLISITIFAAVGASQGVYW